MKNPKDHEVWIVIDQRQKSATIDTVLNLMLNTDCLDSNLTHVQFVPWKSFYILQ